MAKKKVYPNVGCDDCPALPKQPCVSTSGRVRGTVHVSRKNAAKTARQTARRESELARAGVLRMLPGGYHIGPELVTVKTDLLYLDLYAPELVTPARRREADLNDGMVSLQWIVESELLDQSYTVTVGLENVRLRLPDKLVRHIRRDMELLDARHDLDCSEERRTARAADRMQEMGNGHADVLA